MALVALRPLRLRRAGGWNKPAASLTLWLRAALRSASRSTF